MAYAIGQPEPEILTISTYGTESTPIGKIHEAVLDVFSFSVAAMISRLSLRSPPVQGNRRVRAFRQ
jgi:S-adenosylmethionine synthetase